VHLQVEGGGFCRLLLLRDAVEKLLDRSGER
jgi:hypothetical protein